MGFIRHAAVAGQFYPSDAAELKAAIEGYLADAPHTSGPRPKALIAPHAGYVYSGPIAASAYVRLQAFNTSIKRVALLGPCHRVAVRGVAISSADFFETPLGRIEIDRPAVEEILSLPQVEVVDATHELEHSLEVHLPFLQVILGDFKLVPLVVGEASPESVSEVIDLLWGGVETLIVVSSDLSHYQNYDTARDMDKQTSLAIENLTPDKIDRNGACGRFPVGGLLDQAKKRNLVVSTLDVRNSGDTAGSKERVVGYGSWMFCERPPKPATATEPTETLPPPKRTVTITLKPVEKPKQPVEATSGRIVEQAVLAPTQEAITPSMSEGEFEEASRQLLEQQGPNLLLLAALAIDHGIDHGEPLDVQLSEHPEILRANGASFVTLKKNGDLRGCIGSPQAYRPLINDIAHNAYRAAFADPRFPKLAADERGDIDISVSVLSPAVAMTFEDEKDFFDQLRPGIDGLIIEDMGLKSLFLPSVWTQLQSKNEFVGRLKVKAGMPRDHWSSTFKAMRFIAEEISASDLG